MRNEGSEVKKKSKVSLARKKGKMVAGENGLKNGLIENGLIQWSPPALHITHTTFWGPAP